MSENTILDTTDNQQVDSSWKQILLFVLAAGIGMTLGHALGMVLIKVLFGGSWSDILRQLQYPYNQPSFKWPFMVLQGSVSISTFLLFPYFLAARRYKLSFKGVFSAINFSGQDLLILIGITWLTMLVSGSIGEWNKLISLPEWLDWMTSKDEILEKLTVYITTFDNINYFLFAVVIIAVIPAIGEEFLFRGLLQPHFIKLTKNHHAGIWITAFIFSAIHMQFYGLLPRFFIGAVLGYIYLWKKSLIYPAVIHLLNNGITISFIYLHQLGKVETDVEEFVLPNFITIVISVSLLALMIYYKRLSSPSKTVESKQWTPVYEDEVRHRAEMVKDILAENEIPAVLINKKDSAYQFGAIEVSVESDNVLRAIKIIEDDIKFG